MTSHLTAAQDTTLARAAGRIRIARNHGADRHAVHAAQTAIARADISAHGDDPAATGELVATADRLSAELVRTV